MKELIAAHVINRLLLDEIIHLPSRQLRVQS